MRGVDTVFPDFPAGAEVRGAEVRRMPFKPRTAGGGLACPISHDLRPRARMTARRHAAASRAGRDGRVPAGNACRGSWCPPPRTSPRTFAGQHRQHDAPALQTSRMRSFAGDADCAACQSAATRERSQERAASNAAEWRTIDTRTAGRSLSPGPGSTTAFVAVRSISVFTACVAIPSVCAANPAAMVEIIGTRPIVASSMTGSPGDNVVHAARTCRQRSHRDCQSRAHRRSSKFENLEVAATYEEQTDFRHALHDAG